MTTFMVHYSHDPEKWPHSWFAEYCRTPVAKGTINESNKVFPHLDRQLKNTALP